MFKKANTSRKYYLVLFLVVIIAVGFIVYLNKRFIVNFLGDQSAIPAPDKSEARVIFDVHSITKEDASGKRKEIIATPRIIGYGDASAETAFKEETFMEINNSVYQFGKDDFLLIAKEKTLSEANDIINQIATEATTTLGEMIGISQVSPRSYVLEESIFSGVFDFYSTGGAHPITSVITVNYDLLNQQPIQLFDILNISYESIERMLDRELNKSNILSSSGTDKISCSKEELIPRGFSVTDKELVIFTSRYFANTFCPESFTFEYSEIKDIINNNGPLMRIIKK